MRKNLLNIAVSSLFAATLVAAPLMSRAEDAPAKTPAATDDAAPAKAKKKGTAFMGSLVSVDTNAMTLTVTNLTLHVTSETTIKKGSQPAKLSDAVVGQPTSGTYKTDADGKLEALTLHLNSKAGGKGAGGKKKKVAADGTTPASAATGNN